MSFGGSTPFASCARDRSHFRDELDGVWSARRGTYQVLYQFNEELREIVVLRSDHRRDAYRPLT
jgi:mRNA-degrading endonuclease RelE of RelBE toxin-antitoxin system